jgi:large subunit ribosomal protein L7/L12
LGIEGIKETLGLIISESMVAEHLPKRGAAAP